MTICNWPSCDLSTVHLSLYLSLSLSLSLSTLFGLYIDEILEFIAQQRGSGIDQRGIEVCIMLYAIDIVILSSYNKVYQVTSML